MPVSTTVGQQVPSTRSKGRSLLTSLLLLLGLPLFVGISAEGAIAVLTNLPYQASIKELAERHPAAASVLQGNLDDVAAMGPAMQWSSGLVFVFGLWMAFQVAGLFAGRFSHIGKATVRIAAGQFDEEIARLHDPEFDPLIDDLNVMRRRMQERVALEVEHTELGKAMELGAEVQRMFLPSHSELGHPKVRAGSAYRPATTCGGDFWFSHMTRDGRLLVFVGDVTGHGTAAAVVTAAVATQIRMQIGRMREVDVERVLVNLNRSVLDLCRGSYRMTMAVLDISADAKTLHYHSAGAPPVMLRTATGEIEALTVAGVPLGSNRFSSGSTECALQPGTRIHVFTDGIIEAEREDGRAFGLRRISTQLIKQADAPVEEACANLLRTIDEFAAGVAQDDDWTMLALEVA